MPVLGSSRPKTLARCTSQAARVAQRPAAFVLVLHQRRMPRAGRAGGMTSAPGLDGGLLVGRDHVFIRPQSLALKAAGVQVQDSARLGLEVGVAGKDPAAMRPGADDIVGQPAPNGGPRDGGDRPARDDLSADVRDVEAVRGRGRGGSGAHRRSPSRRPPVQGEKSGRRPRRGRSSRPAMPSWKKRLRHLLTTSRRVLSRRAISSWASRRQPAARWWPGSHPDTLTYICDFGRPGWPAPSC